MCGRHATHYLALAEEAEPKVWVPDQPAWFNRLAIEHDNLRAALRWLTESNAVEPAVRLGGALWPLWLIGGYLMEGQANVRILLALPGAASRTTTWSQLVFSAGMVEMSLGNYTAARTWLEQAVALRRTLGERLGLATALSFLGQVGREQEDWAAARTWLDESLELSRELGDRSGMAHTLQKLGTVAHALGDYTLARSLYLESLSVGRQVDDQLEQAWSLHNLGCLALDHGDYPAARAWLAESLALRGEHDRAGFVHALAAFACLAAAEGSPARALQLAGASAALTQKTGILVQHTERGRYEHCLATARQALGSEHAAAAWAEGQAMSLDQALTYALEQNAGPGRADSASDKST